MFTTVPSNKKSRSRSEVPEQVISFLVTLIAAIVVLALGAPDRWLAAIFETFVTFGGMISFFRSRWRSMRFWSIIAGLLSVHTVLVCFIFGVLLQRRRDVGLLVCLPFILLESFVIYHTVRFLED
jgi:hypothetical protein